MRRAISRDGSPIYSNIEQILKDAEEREREKRASREIEREIELADREVERVMADDRRGDRQERSVVNPNLNPNRSVDRHGNLYRQERVPTPEFDQDRAPGLHQMFKRLAKPIAVLNDPERRDLPEERERVQEHLAEVTPSNVRRALLTSLLATEENLRDYVLDAVMEIREASKRELEEVQLAFYEDRHRLKSRLKRLEENEKLSNRITTEKKDSVKPNPSYPTIPASEDLVRKAALVMAANIRIVERKITFDKEPFNFLYHLCLESNKVAATHNLTKDQQRDLILSHIPSSEPEYNYIAIEKSLSGIFAIVSTMSNSVLTITEIEKRINSWTIDNTTDTTMYKSITALLDLICRSQEHRSGNTPIRYPEVFRQTITRIQREKLPKVIYDNLNEARIRIRDSDPIPELNNILIGALNRY